MLIKYCKALKFEEDPNYAYMKGLLKDVFTRNNFEYDFIFDWNNRPAPLERKSTFSHLLDHQHQLVRRQTQKKELNGGADKYGRRLTGIEKKMLRRRIKRSQKDW